jgi:hypothetical protein
MVKKRIVKKASGAGRVKRRAVKRRPRKISFDRLSPEAQRVAIAKDVLAQIEAKKLMAKRGTYVSVEPEDITKEFKDTDQVRDLFAASKKCQACAVGSLFMSAVGLHDKLTINQAPLYLSGRFGVGHSGCYGYLTMFFSEKQLEMMETIFEGTSGSATARLKSLMENVIENNGQFVPTRRQDTQHEFGYYDDNVEA